MKPTHFDHFYRLAIQSNKFAGIFRWKDVEAFCKENGINVPAPLHMKPYKTGEWGKYNLSLGPAPNYEDVSKFVESSPDEVFSSVIQETYIPPNKKEFIPFGCFDDLYKIVESRRFIPTYITGDTGYGKTMAVEQICSRLNRDVIRINCTPFTSEDELIGHYILEDGTMVWKDGPVLVAMERGAILLLDEVDALDPKRGSFALFSLLEGSGVFVKKLNKRFYPNPGFNTIATANTKGKGDIRGRHIGTNVQNEAFLDRFKVMLDHGAPNPDIERKILTAVDNTGDYIFIEKVILWCNIIRKSFDDDGCEDVISTRRACNIVELYSIFREKMKVIQMTISKFDDETKSSFIELYKKVDENFDSNGLSVNDILDKDSTEEYPF